MRLVLADKDEFDFPAYHAYRMQHAFMGVSKAANIHIFTHSKLCLATAIHNFKWVKITFPASIVCVVHDVEAEL